MKDIHFNSWLTRRRRKSVAMAIAGWLSLSLVLVFWPCCESLADEHPPVTGMQAGDHGHDHMPQGTDPCRTWLDATDAALSTSPDVQISEFELKIAYRGPANSQALSIAALLTPDRKMYHASPPSSLPLYLLVHHLLI